MASIAIPAGRDASERKRPVMRDTLRTRYREERLPRYTSYPTAPQFSDTIRHETYEEWLAAIPGGTTASLYLHVPFCRSMCWYCGCHTTITQRDAPIVDYLDVLRREIGLVAARLCAPLPVRHVHFGLKAIEGAKKYEL